MSNEVKYKNLCDIPCNLKISTDYREYLLDQTIKQVKSSTWTSIKQRSRTQIVAFFQRVDKKGIIHFMTPSGTTPGKYWKQQVKLLDFDKNKKKGMTGLTLLRNSINGNVALHCDDPSFLYYGFKYIAYNNGYGLKPEKRFPTHRNRALNGSCCKHLYQVLTVLPFNTDEIYKQFKKQGLL